MSSHLHDRRLGNASLPHAGVETVPKVMQQEPVCCCPTVGHPGRFAGLLQGAPAAPTPPSPVSLSPSLILLLLCAHLPSCALTHGNLDESQSFLNFGADPFRGLHELRHYRLVRYRPDSLVTERQQRALQGDVPGQGFPSRGASGRTMGGHSYGAGRHLAALSMIKLASHSAITGMSLVHEISLDIGPLFVR
jgi:hypothetical protein